MTKICVRCKAFIPFTEFYKRGKSRAFRPNSECKECTKTGRRLRKNMVNNNTYEQLVEDFGLCKILEQNDIEEWEALRFLFEQGFLDIKEYIFEELKLDLVDTLITDED